MTVLAIILSLQLRLILYNTNLLTFHICATTHFTDEVVNSGSFHWALSVFISFHFMLAFRVQFAGDMNQKILFVTTLLSNTFAYTLLGLIHWSPSCALKVFIFSNLIHIRLNCFFRQWVCIEHWI